MGPTAIIPQSHLLSRDDADWSRVIESPANLAPSLTEHFCTAPAHQGTAVLLHSAMFHRGSAMRLVRGGEELPRRAMIKLIFHRCRAPESPEWDHQPGFDVDAAASELCTETALLSPVRSLWAWLLGSEVPAAPLEAVEVAERCDVLSEPQRDGDEATRVGACYELAAAVAAGDGAALAGLADGLELSAPPATRRVAVHGLGEAGATAVPTLLSMLCRAGDAAAAGPSQALYEQITHCADALGEAASGPAASLEMLVETAEALVAAAQLVHAALADRSEPVLLGEAPAGELWWEHGAEGSLASCIVALDHIAQRAVTLGLHEPCELVADALLPLCREGEGDLVAARGFAGDLGRALSRRGCVLACEALRNLCLLPGMMQLRPQLAPTLAGLVTSDSTSSRLAGVAADALRRLTANGSGPQYRQLQQLAEAKLASEVAVDPFWRDVKLNARAK